jgi:hypothetical protein
MKVGDIRPVQPAERASDRNSSGGEFRGLAQKPRHQFSCVFREDEGAIYQLLDEDTGMVLAQVPSEEVVRVAKRLQQLLSDRKAK